MGHDSMPSVTIVDSDATNCLLLREICHVGGWNVAGTAHTLADGLALSARTRPDCLITDYQFGNGGARGETGLDLIVRAKSLIPRLFTIILTGWDINEIAARISDHQPDRILRKPVPPHLLMNLLESIQPRVDAVRAAAL